MTYLVTDKPMTRDMKTNDCMLRVLSLCLPCVPIHLASYFASQAPEGEQEADVRARAEHYLGGRLESVSDQKHVQSCYSVFSDMYQSKPKAVVLKGNSFSDGYW